MNLESQSSVCYESCTERRYLHIGPRVLKVVLGVDSLKDSELLILEWKLFKGFYEH